MKHFTIVLWIMLLGLGFGQNHANAQEGGGHSTGNGGKGINAYLTDAIMQIEELLVRECAKSENQSMTWYVRACQVPTPLFDRIMKTKIMSDYIVYGKIDNRPRDAINDTLDSGESFVVYSIRALLKAAPEERRRVLLHEFMTLAGFESSDSYGYSTLVLSFLSECPELKNIMSQLPNITLESKTFRGLEVTVFEGTRRLPVIIQSAADYRFFCIAKGFSEMVNLHLVDVSYAEWRANNPGNQQTAAVTLNSEGIIDQIIETPNPKKRVIQSITCK